MLYSPNSFSVIKQSASFTYNGKVIIKRFETKFIPLDTLKDFNLDYIRLARDYTNDITNDYTKQSFVESICEGSKLLNIKVFAERVNDSECFITLKELGLYSSILVNKKETK